MMNRFVLIAAAALIFSYGSLHGLADPLCDHWLAILRSSSSLAERTHAANRLVRQMIPEGSTVYRGLRLPKSARKNKLKNILQGSDFHPDRASDHWTISSKVAQDFARGAYLKPDGTSGSMEDTVQIIIEAEAGPNDVDVDEFQRVATCQGVSKGNVDSYFSLDSENVGASANEKEVPILKSRYSGMKITAYWILNPDTKKWERKTPEQNPGAFE